MSRCGETCGKTSQLNGERGVRRNSQTDAAVNFFFLTFLFQEEKLLKVSLEKQCSKEGRNPQMSYALLL